ncbi:ste12 interacting protein [Metarhizium anisopliae]|nr:ste12 interacting protein [Metarhizium anisopliae]
MSPTYTMSAHLCKQFYASWRQSRPAATTAPGGASSPQDLALLRTRSRSRSPLAEGKRSMDSDRSDASTRRDSSASAR